MKKIITAITTIILAFGFSNESFAATTNRSICQGDSTPFLGQYYSQAGMYINGSDTLLVNVRPRPIINVSHSNTLCQTGVDSLFISVSGGAVGGFVNIWWQGGSTILDYTDTLITSTAGIYNVGANNLDYSCYTLVQFTVSPCIFQQHDTANICQGDSFVYRGNSYSQTGVYSDTVAIDSVYTLHLTANAVPTISLTHSNTFCMGADTLFANVTGATQVQWILNGTVIDTTTSTNTNLGSIVAGGNGTGSAANQLRGPHGFFVALNGEIYVADYQNHRIQKFPAGSTSATNGVTVAGGNGQGNAANQLNSPSDVFVAANGEIYVADWVNQRVQKFPANSTSATNGITVAGGNGAGSAANQFQLPRHIYVDNNSNLYVVDRDNHRIQKFPAGSTSATNGVTVAGGNGAGSTANQLNQPQSLHIDNNGNLYVADKNNNRIQKFPAGSTSATNGVTVAGGNGAGSTAAQFNYPIGVFVNNNGELYVADISNNRIQKFPAGSTSASNGITVASVLSQPTDVAIHNGDLYVSELNGNNSSIRKINPSSNGSGNQYVATTPGTYTAVISNACGTDSATIIVAPCNAPRDTIYQSICQGDSVLFDSHYVSATGAYTHYFLTGSVIDSIQVLVLTVNPNPQLQFLTHHGSVCQGGDSLTIQVGGIVSSAQIDWSLNGNVTQTDIVGAGTTVLDYTATTLGTYLVTATTTAGCTDTMNISVVPCLLSDSVWPGDADHNGICDNYDLLPIGIAHGLGGPARATTSIVWNGYYCANWGLQLLNGTNAKHIDCDGDGAINVNDAQAVIQNFGLTHNKEEEQRKPDRAGISGLYIVFEKDTLQAGDTLVASVRLGTPEEPVSDVYGLAFTYNFDATVIDTSTVSFTYTNSWLGGNTDKLSLAKKFNDIGKIKTAVTRFDHVNRSGSGEIAQFRGIITTDNINGKDLSYYTTSHFISGLKAIDKDENVVELNEGVDSAKIGYEEKTGIRELSSSSWSLYPNPANHNITIKNTENIEGIVIWNVLGEKVYEVNNVNQESQTISISNLANGIYVARLQTTQGSGEKRFIVAK